MLVVIYPEVDIWNFVLKDVKEKFTNIRFIPLNKFCNKIQRVVRQKYPDKYLPAFMLFGFELRKLLNSLTYGDSVLLCDYTSVNIVKTIRAFLKPKVKLCLWYWNPISNNKIFEKQVVIAKELQCSVYTFNPSDSQRFSLMLLNQFFPMFPIHQEFNIEIDFYFQGYDKGRRKILEKLNQHLKNYKTDINIVTESSNSISYEKYIQNVCKSRCIIDVVQEGQSGLTLRPLEALAYGKKLITNNRNIMNYDFYNKENIFILGYDEEHRIGKFIYSPFVKIETEIKRKYDTATWIKQFS